MIPMPPASASLYESALRPRRWAWLDGLRHVYTAFGLAGLTALAWTGWPFGGWFLRKSTALGAPLPLIHYLGIPAMMALRAVILVEVIGYLYHRFFQHVGFFTRQAELFRKSQRFHWIHHMVIYPIGRFYRRPMDYVSSEQGIAWSWVLPSVLVTGLFTATNGLNLGTLAFIVTVAAYAKGLIDKTHERFHVVDHPWVNLRYFQWLEKIHLLHHWDQRTNFTIVHPAMDILFGTYLSPRTHERELQTALEDKQLTASDLINWRYLLIEATPAEYAAFISTAKRHRRSLRKIGLLLEVLRDRIARHPEDSEAADLHRKALDLLEACGVLPADLPGLAEDAAVSV